MAYQTFLLYNLEGAVGPDCPNHFSDVMLIELLLQIWSKNRSVETWRTYATLAPSFASVTSHPRPTGRYKKELQGWIDFYLSFCGRTHDGRFDPMKDREGSVTIDRGGQKANLYQLCRDAMAEDTRAYYQVGTQLGLRINLGLPGHHQPRNQVA